MTTSVIADTRETRPTTPHVEGIGPLGCMFWKNIYVIWCGDCFTTAKDVINFAAHFLFIGPLITTCLHLQCLLLNKVE